MEYLENCKETIRKSEYPLKEKTIINSKSQKLID